MKLFGSLKELVSIVFRSNSRQLTISPASQTTGDATITIPDQAGVSRSLVLDTQTQTLTNKTLTAPVISTISNTGTLTLPTSTDTLVGRATTDTLTNKTLTSPAINTPNLDGGTASATSRVVVSKDTTTNLNSLTRKQAAIYYDTTTGQFKGDDGSSLTAFGSTTFDGPTDAQNYTIVASVGSNALTLSLKTKGGADPSSGDPVKVAFRSSTAATGDYTVVSATAATSITVSSGSTLGHSSGVANWFYVYAINNSGTIELGVSTRRFDSGSVVSTTAEGGSGAADSASVLYTTTARTNKACQLLARINSTQTVAGTWAAVPTEISLGQKFISDPILGNILGLTANIGEVGETVTAAITTATSTTTAGTEIDVTDGTVSLTAGNWLVSYSVSMQTTNNSGSAQSIGGRLRLVDNSNTPFDDSATYTNFRTPAGDSNTRTVTKVVPITLTSSTNVKLRVTCNLSTANGRVRIIPKDDGDFGDAASTGSITAVRIR